MRISDWSSDVCSSDLHRQRNHFLVIQFGGRATDIPGVPQEHFRPLPSFLSSQNVIREPHKRGSQRHIFRIRVTLGWVGYRSEEHTSELQSLMRTSYAVFCLNNKK